MEIKVKFVKFCMNFYFSVLYVAVDLFYFKCLWGCFFFFTRSMSRSYQPKFCTFTFWTTVNVLLLIGCPQ